MSAHPLRQRQVLAWACYDWANSAFATTVMAGFFPIFFKQYWSTGVDATVSTWRLGMANSAAGLTIAVLAPLLGAIADRGGIRKRFLFAFAILGVGMSASLHFVSAGHWQLAALIYVVATIGFLGGNVFYDSLLIDVSPPDHYDLVSAFGYGMGYLGGGVLFAVNVAMTLWPAAFGFADAATAVRFAFLSVAVWWLLFSLPLFLLVREHRPASAEPLLQAVRSGMRQLLDTFRAVRALRNVFLFLAAYWLYIDGVHTIIQMAVDYGLALGFPANSLIVALLITQFVGFPAAIAFGYLGERMGTRQAIFVALAAYLGVTVWAAFLDRVEEFYAMAIAIGLVQGGLQSLSRSFYARLVPEGKSAEFFGFYNMVGKFAAVLGPFLTGWVALLSGSSRLGILAIALLFAGGALILTRVSDPARVSAPTAA